MVNGQGVKNLIALPNINRTHTHNNTTFVVFFVPGDHFWW